MNKLFKFNLIVIICVCFCFFIGCNKEVKFDVNFIVEGEIFETIGTSGNEVIAIPADPIKDGYTFDGWYWDKDVWVNPFTANSLLNVELRGNVNVYARFLDEDDPVGVELKFEGFDLIESQDTGDVFYGEVANSQVYFAFSNYVEVSNKATWTVSKDVSGNDIVNSKTVVLELGNNLFFIQVTDETGKVKQYNIVVRRHLMYNVYFNTNGGSYVNSIVVEEDSFIDKPITSRTGYTFMGWDFDFNEPITSNLTVNAMWEAKQYKVSLDADGGSCSNSLVYVSYDEYYSLPTPVKAGYTFNGWYYENKKVNDGIWKTDEDISLVAKWIIANYNITYDLKGGKNNENNPDAYTFENDDITLLDASKTGYTFIGWTSNNIAVPTKNLLIEKGTTGELKFIANYTPNEYQITLDVNGGDELNDNKVKVVYDSEFSLPIPKKTGYEFKGWYNGTTKVNEGIWKYLNDLELTAKWNIINYNINYELDGGENSEYNPLTYTYDDETIFLSDPYKKGHKFIGWITDEVFIPTSALEVQHNSTGDFTFIAVFEVNTYTITFDVNGGDQLDINEMEVVYGEYVELPVPTNGSYPFAGWHYEGEIIESGIWDFEGSFTLKARWINIYIYTENEKTYVNLGRYPQTVITDSSIISNLNKITTTNSLGYIEYLGAEYKKVIAYPYRDSYTFINGDLIKEGYAYYFKVEPIKWRVRQESNGTYMLLCEYILDNLCYYNGFSTRNVNGTTVYANNYMYSNVRAWLNGLDGSSYNVTNYTGKGFLDIAFTKEEQRFINTTLVINSAFMTSSNSCACSDTTDKVYLLGDIDYYRTYLDETNTSAIGTDYARSKGCYIGEDTSSMSYGKSCWWLRTPVDDVPYSAYCSYSIGSRTNTPVNKSYGGVRPALEITIK